jgi:bifunctional ADP-heptose synthase (sugar kinase/adenylyltransferase)
MIDIVVIGETCVDEFIYTNSTRLSPEAPVPVLIPLHKTTSRGMSGNVVSNLEALAPETLNIKHYHQTELITKTRYVDDKSNHIFVRVDSGESNIQSLELDNFTEDIISHATIAIVSDYNKGFLTDKVIARIGNLSKLSILDSKRKLTEDIQCSYTFVKLNEGEAINNRDITNTDNILITLGARGCKHADTIYPSPKPQETIDVSGAGDTFTAAFILEFYKTKNVATSIDYANRMASVVVSKRGVATINN